MGDGSMEEMKREVLEKLYLVNADQVKEIATALDVKVADVRKSKPGALRNAVVRYMTSEVLEDLEDEGLSEFLKLNDILNELLESKTKLIAKTEMNATDKSSSDVGVKIKADSEPSVKVTIELHKLKEFRVTGGTVASDKNRLEYMNLCRQI